MQVPLTQVARELVQSTHVPPVFPHAVSAMPDWQVPLSAAEQQPPLQGPMFGELHCGTQTKMPASRQARPALCPLAAGQSPADVHPQWPLTQALPAWLAASHTAQSPPFPQALSIVPGWQVPPPQQPPWQIEWFASPHAPSHWPVVVLQAVPTGQSPAPVQNGAAGAQSNFGARGVTERLPNWSFNWNAGKLAVGHLIL
jgi:hypothetical protein